MKNSDLNLILFLVALQSALQWWFIPLPMLKQTLDIPLTGEYAHKLNIDLKEEATLKKSFFLFRNNV